METTVLTLRETARQAVLDAVPERAALEHQRNYHRLHVRRDGTVRWFEAIDQHSDIIDSQASGFAAIHSVCLVGTGSYGCNCDYCNEIYNERTEADAIENGDEYKREEKYDTEAEAIADAVANSDLDDVTEDMLREFDEIPVGYFDDEEETEE